jgi:hypothetical protein
MGTPSTASASSAAACTNDEDGHEIYAGQHRDGYACGLGVVTQSDGYKDYAEHGPDGKYDGRCFGRWTDGETGYSLFERGKEKEEYARVFADGTCVYNGKACAPDDPRLLALIAQVAPVEVRPAARAPHALLAGHSPPSNRPMDRPARFAPRRRWRPPWPPRCIPMPHVVAGGRAAQPNSRRTVPCDRFPPGAFLPGCAVLDIPFGFGRPRKPWPTCQCAWRCAPVL